LQNWPSVQRHVDPQTLKWLEHGAFILAKFEAILIERFQPIPINNHKQIIGGFNDIFRESKMTT